VRLDGDSMTALTFPLTTPSDTPSRSSERILVVDDDAAFGEMVVDLLEERGYSASSCTSPDEALARTAEASYAVAILDLVMPGIGGLELAAAIAAQGVDTLVIVLTGHGDLDSAIASIQRGIVDYLQKTDIDV